MRSKIILCITILCVFLLQSTLIERLSIGAITPNLVLIFCVSIGLMRGRKSGLLTGFFSGLLIDIFYGSLLGVYALIYMYVGYLSGYAHQYCYDDDLKVPVMLVAVLDLFYGIAVYGLQFLLRGRLEFKMYLVRIILPEICYTVFLTLICYRIIRLINYHLIGERKRESESIWVLK